jgi:F-type H+-transporting ATPase subunit epsilon
MKTFTLKISSPDGDLFSGEVVKLNVRGTEGELAVMAGHIPFVTALVESDCSVELEDGEVRFGHTDGGMLSVASDMTLMLSGGFVWRTEE